MKLKPGCEEEYQQRHSPVWKEMEEMLGRHGVRNYSIFLDDPTGTLFGYAEIESEDLWNSIAETEVCGRWWARMTDLMFVNPDNSPISTPLREVFHLD